MTITEHISRHGLVVIMATAKLTTLTDAAIGLHWEHIHLTHDKDSNERILALTKRTIERKNVEIPRERYYWR